MPFPRLLPPLLAFVLAAGLHAGPAEDAVVAAVRLSEVPSYSWLTTVSDDARTYEIEGRTVRGGYTRVKMPVVNTLRRRLGNLADPQVELIFRGNVACVLRTDEGWFLQHELPEEHDPFEEPRHVPPPPGGMVTARPNTGAPLIGGLGKQRNRRGPDAEPRSYSNLQLAISHPHEDLGVIVGSHATFEADGDTVAGDLTPVGAQLLLVRDGQSHITPIRASGSFRLWLRGGHVVRYSLKLEGTLSIESPRGRTHVNVQQTSTTVVRDIGTTKFEVPPEAAAKLGR